MKLRLYILVSFILFARIIHAQHIEDLGVDKPLGALASGEIQIINTTENAVTIKYSLDKVNWREKSLGSKEGITATLNIRDSKWYVKVCNKNDQNVIECDQYPLLPKKRYIIDTAQGKLVLKKT